MRFPNKEIVERIRRQFPVGCRVELLRMDDVQAPPIGTKGTVTGVDDTASIMVSWDNGSGLNVVYGEDLCQRCDDDR
ncbi:DUF4314 domain-containing protein [Dehalobacter sp.]|uniref:DUF4314 domain-containing protein n=1 Tax=Dehalobacter sp. TaxID=1962289 RepID=UPI00258EF2EF|nr:DUF4314 domain-containing protein [Dehalobacter sp.]MCG1024534.1 DUF4314 domain-containing protein [Dehalobacter sp.]